jgi:hypothetical protein
MSFSLLTPVHVDPSIMRCSLLHREKRNQESSLLQHASWTNVVPQGGLPGPKRAEQNLHEAGCPFCGNQFYGQCGKNGFYILKLLLKKLKR